MYAISADLFPSTGINRTYEPTHISTFTKFETKGLATPLVYTLTDRYYILLTHAVCMFAGMRV